MSKKLLNEELKRMKVLCGIIKEQAIFSDSEDERVKKYDDRDSLITDGFIELKNKLGVEFSIDDFEVTDRYDSAEYLKTKENPSVNHKVERVLELLGRNKTSFNGLLLKINNDYLWSNSKYSLSLNTAEFVDGRLRSSQNFFIYPYYANKYGDIKGGLSN